MFIEIKGKYYNFNKLVSFSFELRDDGFQTLHLEYATKDKILSIPNDECIEIKAELRKHKIYA